MQWQHLKTLAHIHSTWLDIFCEHWQNEQGHQLDYWRIEKADSIIVLPLWRGFIVLPPPSFRVGINQPTYDFPGGRVLTDKTSTEVVVDILKRELNVVPTAIEKLMPLNQNGWFINSAFSNQKLYGFIAQICSDHVISEVGQITTNTLEGILKLLAELDCLQCRTILLEWLRRQIQDTGQFQAINHLSSVP